MIVRVPNFGEIKDMLTLSIVAVSMTLKIENINYSPMPPEVTLKDFLMMKVWCDFFLTLSLKFLARLINRTIILGTKNPGGRTIILGWRE